MSSTHPAPANYLQLCDRADKYKHRVMLDANHTSKPATLRLLYVESHHGTRLAQTTVAGDLAAAADRILKVYKP